MTTRRGLFLGAPLLVAAACAPPRPATPTRGPAHAVDGLETARGRFAGLGGADVSGEVSVFRADGGRWAVSFAEDFRSDVAEATVALGDDDLRPDARLGLLKACSGAQVYDLPETLDIGDYLQVWLWDEARGERLARADLELL